MEGTPPAAIRLDHALLVAALAIGRSEIETADDSPSADLVAALTALGAVIELRPGEVHVYGRGVGGWIRPGVPLALGRATPAGLGALAGHGFGATLIGTAPPLGRSLALLAEMGAATLDPAADRLPLSLSGRATLRAIEATVRDPAALDAVLLAGVHALGTTTLTAAGPASPLEAILPAFGGDLAITPRPDGRRITITGGRELVGTRIAGVA